MDLICGRGREEGGGVWEGGQRGEGALNAALLRFTGGGGGAKPSKSSSEGGNREGWFSLGAHVKLAAIGHGEDCGSGRGLCMLDRGD